MRRILDTAVISLFSLTAHATVVLVYHRFGENQYPHTNVTMAQFKAQMAMIKSEGFTVIPLKTLVEDLRDQTPLPKKSVVITIDDAYRSIYTNAWPILEQYHYPFTVFVATKPVDWQYPAVMSWAMIKDLQAHGVEIENHSTLHKHFPFHSIEFFKRDLMHAETRLNEELGVVSQIYAYPYGEFNNSMVQTVKGYGMHAALAQVSGAVGLQTNLFSIPRFAMDEHYGNLKRFQQILNTEPLAYRAITPRKYVFKTPPSVIQFKVLNPRLDLSRLNCYASNTGKLPLKIQGRVVTLHPQPFPVGRSRINCTVELLNGDFAWMGMPYLILPQKMPATMPFSAMLKSRFA